MASPGKPAPVEIAVDSSALLAILLGEPDAGIYSAKLLAASRAWISPVNWWEVQVRMRVRYGPAGEAQSAAWMTKAGVEVEPISARHAQLALDAFARYRARPAALNMGDCFAWALAKAKNLPLLYKGDDFPHTDLTAV